jgi:ABC-type phosphate transport system substrate-binding protein
MASCQHLTQSFLAFRRKDISMFNCTIASRGLRAVLLITCFGLAVASPQSARAADVTLTETGSTLLQPMFSIWVAAYTKTHPGVQITIGGTGSEAGIKQATSGAVEIGASDAYMSDTQVRDAAGIMNIPLAIAAQTINYNLPGLATPNLKLDGPALAGIYTGAIRQWDAPEIAAMNPGVTLPHQAIIPVHRADGSGDTFVFSQFLTFSTPSWEDDKGYGTTIVWSEVPGALSATGNDGMVKAIQATPYSIGGGLPRLAIGPIGVYRHQAPPLDTSARRRGPMGPMSDDDLTMAIRATLADSPFHGEG